MIILSKKDKMIKRLKSRPKDFTFNEAITLAESLKLERDNKGKTSGSRVSFVSGKHKINIHKPHPHNELKPYQVEQLIQNLEEAGLI